LLEKLAKNGQANGSRDHHHANRCSDSGVAIVAVAVASFATISIFNATVVRLGAAGFPNGIS
jgi:hypothetical protein